MLLRSGDMVKVNDDLGLESVPLWPRPFSFIIQDELNGLETHPSCVLTHEDTAVVVSMATHDATNVFLVCSRGTGWTLGGYLKRL